MTWVVAILTAGATAAADPLPTRSPRIVDYRIDATLDADAKVLQAQQRVTWRNPSAEPVGELWFHLYLNAFRNSESTFMRGTRASGGVRGSQMRDGGWGGIDVTSLRLADGTDLAAALVFEAPDDGNAEDRSLARVPLPAPVAPGASISFDITFTARLPRLLARTGYAGDFFLVAQWFPKLAVYEPAGMRGRAAGGWNAHQFHATTEFYADFGRYDVSIRLPSRFVVGATGQRTATAPNGDGTTTHTFVQEDVHDFAWTADPRYIEQVHTFSATRDVTPQEYAEVAALLGRPIGDVTLSDVEIRLLIQPIHLPQASKYVESAKAAIKWFGLWYGRYPYATLTVVDPAPEGREAGGMEYPTLITGGTVFTLNRWPLWGVRAVEAVTVHEFGHQFWYGLVASNEFEEAWLDEGFTSYSTAEVLDKAYGADRSVIDIPGVRLGTQQLARLQNSPRLVYERVRQPAWSYLDGYGFYSYTKPELLLRTLEAHLGEQTMARVLRTYHERWRFRHPGSEDFYAVANEVSGQDLSWFFRQAVEGTDVLDYEVSSVRSVRPPSREGWREGPDGRRLEVASDEGRGAHDTWRSTVVVRRRGGFVFPVPIALKFEGRPVERVAWDGREPFARLVFDRPERLEWAEVDPDRTMLLDVDWLNNARRAEPDGRAAAKWASQWWALVQAVIATVGW
ncbi:MAG: M1 family metallopeptidase [Vicinamibacterales bacterium]|nr:M1 family metallopeptidase [Vicinamibacterales bacterium]